MGVVLFLNESDVDSVVTMDDALAAVREALAAHGIGKAHNAPRQRVSVGDALLQVMGGAVQTGITAMDQAPQADSGWTLAKVGTSTTRLRRTWSLLFDREASLRCILLSQRLGQLRTGAASGVSADVLARPDAGVLTCLGAGFHAFTQVEAITRLRPQLRVLVWSRTPERSRTFATFLGESFGLDVEARDDADAATAEGDIVVTMTRSAEPVLHGGQVKPGTHTILAGANEAHRREADTELLRRATAVYADDVSQAAIESGDLIMAAQQGALTWDRVLHLGTAVAMAADGTSPAVDPDDISVFCSQGVGTWDTALAVTAYRNATERGVGTRLADRKSVV